MDDVKFVYHVKRKAIEQGVNKSQLARRADVSRETVNGYWEQTTQSPSLPTLKRIATALGVKLQDIVEIYED